MSQRRKFGAEFKAKVALEAIKGLKTINEIASEYQVHPNQITKWKKQLLSGAAGIFSNGRPKDKETEELLKDRLYRQIGQLQVELDWLKKKTRSEY